jgi:hypothetical protein
MKKNLFSLLLLFAVLAFSVLLAAAQTFDIKSSSQKPYVPGETFTYEVKYNKAIFRGLAVADIVFTIERAADGENFLVKADAKTKGSLAKLFRQNYQQEIESLINHKNFEILKSIKHDVQNDRVRDSEAVFDYEKKQVTYVEVDPKDTNRPPRRVASQIEAGTHDFVSGLFFLRTLPLEVGKTFELAVSDTGLIYKIPVRVTKREQQKTELGKVWCFRVEPEVFGKNRLIEQEGSMIIWITDDLRRVPVRSQINAKIGKVEVKIKSYSYKPQA